MNTAIKYESLYKNMQNHVGENTQQLLQAFTLNNNTDILKAAEYYKNKGDNSDPTVKKHSNFMVKRLENIIEQRLLITEDLFAITLPLEEHGPAAMSGFSKTEEEDVNDRKIIEHPAVPKRKKETPKKVEKTVNEKLGEEKKEIKKEEVKTNPKGLKTEYDKRYPTMEAKLAGLNALLPSVEADIKAGNEDSALRKLKYHLKSYGDNFVHFCTIDQIKSLIYWLKDDKFQHVSPFNILLDVPLSIADLVTESTKLVKEDGYTIDKLKEHMKYYILDNQLKDQTEDKIIRSEEEYEKFFQKSMGFLFDETDERNKKVEPKAKEESKEDIKKNLYEIHKGEGWKAIRNIAKDLHDYFLGKKEKSNLTDRVGEVVGFIKTIDPTLYAEYEENKPQTQPKPNTTDKPKDTKKEETEKPVEPKVESSKTSKLVGRVEYPRLTEFVKKRHTREATAEFLISIINKPIGPIGEMMNGIDAQIEKLTSLAKLRFLSGTPVKDCEDWKESDVAEFMAQDVVPFITEEYTILRSSTDEELSENLKYFIKKYPAGEEKARNNALKEVLVDSEKPRTKFMKSIARPIRKDDWASLNTVIKAITDGDKEAQKEKKTK